MTGGTVAADTGHRNDLLGQNRRRHPPELGIGLETAATGATYDIDGGQQLPSTRGGT